ncbi:MDR/zinc-dependent alcohol dehydrogenase-like family protein [Methylobrevis pamukkalensis]|nr:zinc-binding dehydrogenase [Methylobrevis pamukkalensis]
MQAAVLTGPGRMEVARVPHPVPRAGEVLVRMRGCGVCASNLGPWSGPPWMSFPTEPGGLGHEGWGVVAAVGRDVTSVAEGDRVATLFQHSYAEWDVGPEAQVVRLPRELGDRPFPGEPLGCTMNILARSDIRAGHHVAIVGIGFLGALLTRLATDAGAHVIAVSRRPFALDLARRMGAVETLRIGEEDVVARVMDLTEGRGCARVIEATGKQAPLDLAGALTAERGRLVIAGYHQDGPRQIDMQLWNWRGIDVINAHERDPAVYIDGIRAAVAAAAEGRLPFDALLTHRYRLDGLGDALDATRDRPDGFLKAWVDLS